MLHQPVDHRADIYALGIICWEIFSRSDYLLSDSWTLVSERVLAQVRPDIPKFLPNHLYKIIDHSWAHNPSSRPSIDKIITNLEKIRQALYTRRIKRIQSTENRSSRESLVSLDVPSSPTSLNEEVHTRIAITHRDDKKMIRNSSNKEMPRTSRTKYRPKQPSHDSLSPTQILHSNSKKNKKRQTAKSPSIEELVKITSKLKEQVQECAYILVERDKQLFEMLSKQPSEQEMLSNNQEHTNVYE